MVVVDSSALIPLARVGRLDLISTAFETVRTTRAVKDEVLVEGKRGTAALDTFFEQVTVAETPAEAGEIAKLEGIAVGDASVLIQAVETNEQLLANDKVLTTVAQSHGVECWWVTTLLLRCAKTGELTADEAKDVLYNLVNEGINLNPAVYTQIQKKLRELGEK